jgi:hypothetical protein
MLHFETINKVEIQNIMDDVMTSSPYFLVDG